MILKIKMSKLIGVVKNGAITPAANQATADVVRKFAISLIWFRSRLFTDFIIILFTN